MRLSSRKWTYGRESPSLREFVAKLKYFHHICVKYKNYDHSTHNIYIGTKCTSSIFVHITITDPSITIANYMISLFSGETKLNFPLWCMTMTNATCSLK